MVYSMAFYLCVFKEYRSPIPISAQWHAKSTPPKDSQTHIEENRAVAWNGSSELVAYDPLVKEVVDHGSTSIITRIKPGVVLKSPRYSWWHSPSAESHDSVRHIKHSFNVEEQILGILGDHPRIIQYGSSQNFIFCSALIGVIDTVLRLQWCSQAAETIQYIHQKGVIHSDLRPENYLLHRNSGGILNLFLSDFGGSTSGVIDGGHLPDSGFFDPRKPWVSTKATDIFSLGSVLYTIMTGHWPYKCAGLFGSLKEKLSYGERVDELFSLAENETVCHPFIISEVLKSYCGSSYLRIDATVSPTFSFHSIQTQSAFLAAGTGRSANVRARSKFDIFCDSIATFIDFCGNINGTHAEKIHIACAA
uniref:EKC/KEOPS complex subunit BUD32 n=1 Tax=Coccidioides posadasii RMSCC 3488 TaxID=454284 RepID=A0A0J6F653_COCPO|nr:hypothetical protein CPAG_04743 [Coccidioides posadasii RMSCC 3488]